MAKAMAAAETVNAFARAEVATGGGDLGVPAAGHAPAGRDPPNRDAGADKARGVARPARGGMNLY